MLSLDGMPAGFTKDITDLLERHRSKPLSSINVFRDQCKKIIDIYDPQQNPKADEAGAFSAEQKKQIADISIDNGSILESLKES
jgi:hypothetical protein